MISAEQAITLNDRERSILLALLELNAFDHDTRQTTSAVVRKAFGCNVSPESYKRVFSGLTKKNLTDSAAVKGGGIWLTKSGILRAKKLQNESQR